jgi:hypothetical protein
MTVDPRLRRRKHQRGSGDGGALMLNIRVRHIKKKGTRRALDGSVRDALQKLLDTGRMPRGWQFMWVDWKNPDKHGGWTDVYPDRNSSHDPDEFTQAFTRVVQDQIRVAVVRKV